MEFGFSKDFDSTTANKIKKLLIMATKDLLLENKIKRIDIGIKKELGKDVDINFDSVENGFIIIYFGNESAKNIDKNIIYHELGHAHDYIWNNIHFGKEIYSMSKKLQILLGVILNLSLDGRLEKKGLPHISKQEREELLKSHELFKDYEKRKLIMSYWGVEFKSSEALLTESKKMIKFKKF